LAALVTARRKTHGKGMSTKPWIVDVGDADFEQAVLERSKTTPVVVDFWAPWCGPCRTIGPILERLADEHAGAFVLVKINVDEAPATAAAFGIRGIPAVKGFRDGLLVTEFVGAQPEAAIRSLLAQVLPSPADVLTREAASLEGSAAEAKLREALALEPRHGRALVALARRLADRGDVREALEVLERVAPPSPVLDEAERLAAELRTREKGDGDLPALRERVAVSPDDLPARLALGRALAAAGRYEEALGELLVVVQRDRNLDDQGARRAMLDVFAVLGPGDPLTERFRGELAKALFS